jgi:hypothetical protein
VSLTLFDETTVDICFSVDLCSCSVNYYLLSRVDMMKKRKVKQNERENNKRNETSRDRNRMICSCIFDRFSSYSYARHVHISMRIIDKARYRMSSGVFVCFFPSMTIVICLSIKIVFRCVFVIRLS